MDITLLINIFVVFVFTFLWRFVFLLKHPHRGCDPYYYLLCIEEFRKNRKLPIRLPEYFALQHQDQVYPPGLIILCSLLPDSFFRFYWILSPILDSVISSLLFAVMSVLADSSQIAIMCVLVYVFSDANFSEVMYFTPRQLGSLFHSLSIMTYFAYLSGYLGYGALFLAIIFGVSTLMTHKLSTQAFVIGMCMLSLCLLSWNPILFLLTVVVLTFVISAGFYLEIVKGHWHVMSFWHKYSKCLGIDPIIDSPVYGGNPFTSKRSNYGKSFIGLLKFAFRFYFLRDNIYVILSVLLLIIHYSGYHYVSYFYLLCALWSVIVFFIGLLSYLVPFLRGIGFMMQYGKLIICTGTVVCLYSFSVSFLRPLAYLVSFYYIYIGLKKFVLYLKADFNIGDTSAWNLRKIHSLLGLIKQLDNPLIMSIPLNYCDVISYKCRVRVFTGGHNPSFDDLKIIMPYYRDTIENIVNKYGITHLLLDTNVVSQDIVKLNYKQIWFNDNLVFFETNNKGNLNEK